MLTFMMNDREGDFYEITNIIPKLLGYWDDPNKTELDAIKALMADSGCNRFCQGETIEVCAFEIINKLVEKPKGGARLTFNPPLKADVRTPLLPAIVCPRCNSNEVYARALVHGYAYVNLNTCEASEPPDEVDCNISESREEAERVCYECDHEWGVND